MNALLDQQRERLLTPEDIEQANSMLRAGHSLDGEGRLLCDRFLVIGDHLYGFQKGWTVEECVERGWG